MTRPALSSADECTAVHVWAQSSLPGCASAKYTMSAVSMQRAAAIRCRAGCSTAGFLAGAGSAAGCRGALSLSSGGRGWEGCIQGASVEESGAPLTREGPG